MHPKTREKLILTLVGWFAAGLIFFPIFWMILTSFKTEVEAIATPPKLFFSPTLENYITVRERADYIHFAINSIVISVGATLLATLIAVPLAYLISRFEFRGAALIQTLGIIPLVMPPFVGAVAMQLIFGRNGSVNLLLDEWFGFKIPFMEGLNGVIFVEGLHYFPFILLNVSAALANIDTAMEESAQNLGARPLQTFFAVTLPILKPGIVSGAIFAFLVSLDEVPIALFMGGADATTLPVRIFTAIEISFGGDILAVASLIVLASLVLMLILDRIVGLEHLFMTRN